MATFNAGEITARATLDRTPFQRDLDAILRQARKFDGQEFTAKADVNTRAFDKGLAEAKTQGRAFASQRYNAKLGVDRSSFANAMRSAQAEMRRFSKGTGSSGGTLGLDTAGFQRSLRQAERDAAASGITVANNFSSPMRKLKWGAIFAGVLAGAAAVPATLYGVAGAFGALAGAVAPTVSAFGAFNEAQDAIDEGSADAAKAMAKYHEELAKLPSAGREFVQQTVGMRGELESFNSEMMSRTLPGITSFLTGVEQAAPAITDGFGRIGSAMNAVGVHAGNLMRSPVFQGEIEQALGNAVPVAHSLGMAITNLLRDMTEFAAATPSVGTGLAAMLDRTSAGFDAFFSNMEQFSSGIGSMFGGLGSVIQTILGQLGTFVGTVATQLGPALSNLSTSLDSVLSAFNGLMAGALPGVGAAFSGLVTTVGLLGAALGPIAPLIGTLAGSLAPFLVALKAVNLVSFGRISGQFTSLRESMQGVTGRAGKVRTALSGLASIGFGPLGIAAAGLGAALTILGQNQQDAAAEAAAHESRVTSLAGALRESHGAIDGTVRSMAAQKLSTYEVADGTRNLVNDVRGLLGPDALPGLEKAYLGNNTEAGKLERQLRKVAESHKEEAGALGLVRAPFEDHIEVQGGLAYAYSDTGLKAKQTADIISGMGTIMRDAKSYNDGLSAAMASSAGTVSGFGEAARSASQSGLDAALQAIASAAGDASSRTSAFVTVLDTLNGRAPSYEESLQIINDTLRTMKTEAGGLNDNMVRADGTIRTTTEAGSNFQNQLVTMQQGVAGTTESIHGLTQRGWSLKDAVMKVNGDLRRSRQRFLEQADAAGLSDGAARRAADAYGIGTQSLGVFLGRLSATELKQIGVTRTTDNLGNAVYRLPNGKTIPISTPGAQKSIDQVSTLQGMLNNLPSSKYTKLQTDIVTNRVTNYSSNNLPGWTPLGAWGRRDGGPVGYDKGGMAGFAPGTQVQGYPSGGRIRGAGTSRSDSILTATSAGLIRTSDTEYVTRARQTRRHLGLLNYINSGDIDRDMRQGSGQASPVSVSRRVQEFAPPAPERVQAGGSSRGEDSAAVLASLGETREYLAVIVDLLASGVRAEFDSNTLETGLIRAKQRRDKR